VRSAIAQLPGVQGIEVSVDERFVRFKYQAEAIDLQSILAAIAGKDKRFEGRLVLQLEDPKVAGEQFERLRAGLKALKGVRQVSQPDEQGVVLVTLVAEEKTLLGDILKAAKQTGVGLKDPDRKAPPPSEPGHTEQRA
jgi:copper chaperone CopZ